MLCISRQTWTRGQIRSSVIGHFLLVSNIQKTSGINIQHVRLTKLKNTRILTKIAVPHVQLQQLLNYWNIQNYIKKYHCSFYFVFDLHLLFNESKTYLWYWPRLFLKILFPPLNIVSSTSFKKCPSHHSHLCTLG